MRLQEDANVIGVSSETTFQEKSPPPPRIFRHSYKKLGGKKLGVFFKKDERAIIKDCFFTKSRNFSEK